MAKTEKRQDRNRIAMAYLQKNQSKGPSLRRISITNKFVCLFLQGLYLSGKGEILPLNEQKTKSIVKVNYDFQKAF